MNKYDDYSEASYAYSHLRLSISPDERVCALICTCLLQPSASPLPLSLSSLPEASFELAQMLFQPGDSLVLINTFLSLCSHGSHFIESHSPCLS